VESGAPQQQVHACDMTGRVIFMTEEQSMEKTLRALLPKFSPEFREHEHWLILAHQGKSDLEKSFPRKMRSWGEVGVKFVILRDNDGGDCLLLKKNLAQLASGIAKPCLIRIVCQELESWLLGDLAAVMAAYPSAGKNARLKTIRQSSPDALTNAADLLKQLTGTAAKIARAEKIAEHMEIAENRSTSFNVFWRGLSALLAV
jgi:Domain of unknown function (DUF4276)